MNDAPVVSGTATVPPSNEDDPSATGTTVGTLLGQGTVNYTDGIDTVTGGSTGTSSAGIAITGNAATPAQGTWQYFNGTSWVDIPTSGLSNSNALVLANGTALRFVGAANWNGTPGALTAHISDGDTGLPATGLQDIGTPGGTSQWSVGTIEIGTTTPPVNDAPVVSGTATVPPSNEDDPSATGTTVGTLLGQGTVNYTDGIDTVTGGSTGTSSAGIAITANDATAAQGNMAVLQRDELGRHPDLGPQQQQCAGAGERHGAALCRGGELERHAGRADGAHLRWRHRAAANGDLAGHRLGRR